MSRRKLVLFKLVNEFREADTISGPTNISINAPELRDKINQSEISSRLPGGHLDLSPKVHQTLNHQSPYNYDNEMAKSAMNTKLDRPGQKSFESIGAKKKKSDKAFMTFNKESWNWRNPRESRTSTQQIGRKYHDNEAQDQQSYFNARESGDVINYTAGHSSHGAAKVSLKYASTAKDQNS